MARQGFVKTIFVCLAISLFAAGNAYCADVPDGDVTGDGVVTVNDAAILLKNVVGAESSVDVAHGDVAPLMELAPGNYQPEMDGQLRIGDAVVVMRAAAGQVAWDGMAPTSAQNAAYWVDASTNASLQDLTLGVNEEATVRLEAQVPEGNTLKAFKFIVSYDPAIVAVSSVNVSSAYTLNPNNVTINHNNAGNIVFNGFDATGLAGYATVPFVDIVMTGASAGSFQLAILTESYGSAAEDQFPPMPQSLTVTVE